MAFAGGAAGRGRGHEEWCDQVLLQGRGPVGVQKRGHELHVDASASVGGLGAPSSDLEPFFKHC